jgi:hypothetical protein
MDNKFVDYISFPKHQNLHPTLESIVYPSLPHFQNLILYGPSGVGKYTQMLRIIKQYSMSQLKCEKKITMDKNIYIKISDIHYEVDMEMLGCNSKTIWNDIYLQIYDIIQNKFPDKYGIIVCKNFHKINRELLDIFYSYMSSSIKFILLSEAISFIPMNITSKCKIIPVSRPTIDMYETCLQKKITDPVTNIKSVLLNCPPSSPITFQPIFQMIKTHVEMDKMRDELYNILIFDMGIYHFIWMILTTFQHEKIIDAIILFLHHFNNNYRPIYHLEHFVYSIIHIMKDNK